MLPSSTGIKIEFVKQCSREVYVNVLHSALKFTTRICVLKICTGISHNVVKKTVNVHGCMIFVVSFY